MQKSSVFAIGISCLAAMQLSLAAQESVLPTPFEVYGGTIGTIDAIQVPGEANKTRIFASTDSANSVFYADVDHSIPTPFGTNFIFTVLPDMDADANYGTPNGLAAHQQSGRVFVGSSSGLLSCTTSAGSLATDIPDAISFVLIQGDYLFAVNDPGVPETPKTLYYGRLNSDGDLTVGAPLGTNFTGSSVSLAIDPVSNKVYVLCDNQTSFVLLKSLDDFDAFSSATTFSEISVAAVTAASIGQVAVGPDGRLFLGGNVSTIAYSDNDGGSWTNIDTGGSLAGGGSGLNIVCNGSSNAYEVYYGTVVSTNKGANGSWIGLPRPGGYRPPSMHVNAGCTKVDPNNSQFIYVTTDKGIGGSTNAGTDVVELNNGLLAFQINDIDALPDKSVAWIVSKAGMRLATNFNTSPVWTDGDFPDAIVNSCAIDSDDPSGMTGYAGSCRLYKTITGGGSNESSWVQVWRYEDYSVGDGIIRSVKAHGSFVALGYYSYTQNNPSGAVYVSTDSGSNWTAALSNVDVNDLIVRDEAGAPVIYAAISKCKSADRGGIYRIEGATVDLSMTNEVNIRDMAEDSTGGIYASGTITDPDDPARYAVVVYYLSAGGTEWSLLTTSGLPGNLSDGEILGRDCGPVVTVGKDSATNDLPVLAAVRTIYCLPYGGSSWVTITNYPNGTQIKTLFYDELMVGTTIGLYGQAINVQHRASVFGDYDADGKTDLAVYRNGYWSIYSLANGLILANAGEWGGADCTPVPGDYDGDGKSDLTFYRDGYWSIFSLDNGIILVNAGEWGGADCIPVPSDYDGDGKSDLAFYRNGYWSIFSLDNGIILVNAGEWGGADWTPVPGDYDGDGKSDLAVYRNGYWSIFSLDNGIILANAGEWGGADCTPVSGDYDGDGKADLAFYRNGYWSIYSLANGLIIANAGEWGGADATPVPGDYDGDGKSDLAFYRNGYWSIFSLDNGLILNNAGEWGGTGWEPVR
ncbi:MAG: VCBS repeat-containing protein [Verrucomicrobiota bacterium]